MKLWALDSELDLTIKSSVAVITLFEFYGSLLNFRQRWTAGRDCKRISHKVANSRRNLIFFIVSIGNACQWKSQGVRKGHEYPDGEFCVFRREQYLFPRGTKNGL